MQFKINIYKTILLIKQCLIILAFLVIPFNVVAQDIQFSQFYSNVIYLNPAFAGSAHCARAIAHNRLQWPSQDAHYSTSLVSLDNYFQRQNSGVGLMVMKDWQGSNNLSSTEADLQYAYELHLSSKYSMRFGLQAGYVSRTINYAAFMFPDQINNDGYTGNATSQPFGASRKDFLDLSSGTLIYGDNFWFGFAYDHMTQPNQSFSNDNLSRLPSKYDMIGGYRINMNKRNGLKKVDGEDFYITPTIHYKFQGKSDQVDWGTYLLYHKLMAGIWYRGIPILKHYRPGLQNNESMVFQIGFRVNSLSICYSYDVVISKQTTLRTGGAHELNLTYLFGFPKKKKRPMKKLPCPDF